MFAESVLAAFTTVAVSVSATSSLSVKVTGFSLYFSRSVNTVEHLKIAATVTNTEDETLEVLCQNQPSCRSPAQSKRPLQNADSGCPKYFAVNNPFCLIFFADRQLTIIKFRTKRL